MLITRKECTFDMGFTPNGTEEVFTITSVKATKPPTHTIENTLGELFQGTFYEQELQSSVQEFYRFERVLKRGKDRVHVCFWEESPPAEVQGVAKRIRSRLAQAADFQCVR